MPYTVTCDICKETKAIEEYGGRLLIWDFKSFDAMYAAKLCNDCEIIFIQILKRFKPVKEQEILESFGIVKP